MTRQSQSEANHAASIADGRSMGKLNAFPDGPEGSRNQPLRNNVERKDSTDLDLLVLSPAGERQKAKIQSDRIFNLGTVCIVGNVTAVVPPDEILRAVERHSKGDWGLFEDAQLNELGLHQGSWLLSTYRSSGGVRFWVVTTPDRALTSVIFRKGEQ